MGEAERMELRHLLNEYFPVVLDMWRRGRLAPLSSRLIREYIDRYGDTSEFYKHTYLVNVLNEGLNNDAKHYFFVCNTRSTVEATGCTEYIKVLNKHNWLSVLSRRGLRDILANPNRHDTPEYLAEIRTLLEDEPLIDVPEQTMYEIMSHRHNVGTSYYELIAGCCETDNVDLLRELLSEIIVHPELIINTKNISTSCNSLLCLEFLSNI